MIAITRLEQRELIISQYKLGIAPTEIAKLVGSSIVAVVQMARRAGCPPQNQKLSEQGHRSADVRRRKKVQDQRNELNREMSALKKAAGLTNMQQWGRAKKNSDVFWQDGTDTPPDTRCFTARFCGDPLPGRSALDRRQAAAGE